MALRKHGTGSKASADGNIPQTSDCYAKADQAITDKAREAIRRSKEILAKVGKPKP